MTRRTNVYVDGFNLFNRAVKRGPYKWLDLGALGQLLAGSRYTVGRIRYFTAQIKGPGNKKRRERQEVYLRALRTIPNLEIHYGNFLANKKKMPLYADLPKINPVEVLKVEEKGSDVNLATYLLLDAFRNDYDSAIVISNDSDLAEPIRVVREELGKKVGIGNPDRVNPRVLRGDFARTISESYLARCQFPVTLTDKNGTVSKPASWP